MSASRNRSGRSHRPGPHRGCGSARSNGAPALAAPRGGRRPHAGRGTGRTSRRSGDRGTRSPPGRRRNPARAARRPSRRPPEGSGGCGCRRRKEPRACVASSSCSSLIAILPQCSKPLPVAHLGGGGQPVGQLPGEKIPGVGPIGAVLLMMKTPAPELFRSGRQFAAWIGLTPKDHSTAGKVKLGVITRAGDEILRSVLVVGATAVIQQVQRGGRGSPWIVDLLKRKPPKLAAVALANKMARVAWKLMVTGNNYAAKSAPAALASAA